MWTQRDNLSSPRESSGLGFEQQRQQPSVCSSGTTHAAAPQNDGRDCREPRLDALSRTKVLCPGYQEGKKLGPVYTELFWNRSCVLNSYTLIPEALSCEDKPSKGQPRGFSFQNLTCPKPPSCRFCGFTMKIFLMLLRDRNKQGTWPDRCRGMEQAQNATLKHGEKIKSLS